MSATDENWVEFEFEELELEHYPGVYVDGVALIDIDDEDPDEVTIFAVELQDANGEIKKIMGRDPIFEQICITLQTYLWSQMQDECIKINYGD